MTTPLNPGVFVNVSETPLAQSLVVSGESTAAFAAAYNIGPVLPVKVTSWQQFTNLFGTFAQSGGNSLLHQNVYQYFANGGSGAFVCRFPNTDAVAASLTIDDIASPTPSAVMTITANSVGAWGNGVYVAIQSAGSPQRFNLQVWAPGVSTSSAPTENFQSLSVNPADSRYVASVVNSPILGSNYVTVSVTLPGGVYTSGTTDPAVTTATALASGSDGSTAPTLATAVPAAFDTLQDQILNLNLPGVNDATTINTVASWAAGRGDVMVIVDSPAPNPPETSAQVASNAIALVSGSNVITASPYVAVYSPWLYVLDPSSSVSGAMRYVPPGGSVLAIWDKASSNYNINQAPAGTWATVQAQALEAAFTTADLQNLNNAQVNAIKAVPNTGFCVFGARTLDQGLPSRYVPVQRTIIELTHDMENLIAPATFQPNNSTLWQWITTTLTSYLTQQMQSGVLAGNTPATAFSVLCDSSINTPASAQAGYVYAQVGVAVSSPAEFVMISLQLLSGTTTTSTS